MISVFFNGFEGDPPATDAELTRLSEHCGPLPADYLELLREANGGGGWTGEGFFNLHKINTVITRYDERLRDRHPGLLLIGSDGGGMAFGIDLRSGDPDTMEYVEFDAIVLRWEEEFGRWPSLAALFQDLREGKVP